MRIHTGLLFAFTLGLAATAYAQEWEIGGVGGGGFMKGISVASPLASATTGFNSGAAFGAFAGSNLYPHLSGEIRYTYQMNDLKLTAGGTNVSFQGVSHAIHYDFLFHPAPKRSKAQPFVAAGAGVKIYRGTGKEQAYQPLSNLAFLTKTQDLRPLLTVGGGLKYRISERLYFRAELRDYITPFPSKVITPAPGAKVSGWIQDFVPLVGISLIF